uniref:Mohawk homeobox b n=1 Tax=Petromyzon marinus TaxID=7757 RepID=S4RZU6_PETMA
RVRHKRQALQDMARPLKHWLYKHRHNPYPTKTEKILLALGSHMTLVQVSNWFANARRRLKNTVRQPELSWAMRIKLYNQYVQGNAERLSISRYATLCLKSGNSVLDNLIDEGGLQRQAFGATSRGQPPKGERPKSRQGQDRAFPRKYKNSLLHRYLRDSCKHALAGVLRHQREPRRSSHPASLSSACYEDGSLSPVSSESERRQMATVDFPKSGTQLLTHSGQKRGPSDPSSYWNELHAAMALTNL